MIHLARPDVRIVAVEPEAAALLAGKPWSPHKIQGWTPDFIPGVLNRAVPTSTVTVSDAEAFATARALAQKEGIFVGISAGATVAATLNLAKQSPAGTVLLAMLPDTGERYLSTALFEGIADGSDPEP
jgi:cysteine synthase A